MIEKSRIEKSFKEFVKDVVEKADKLVSLLETSIGQARLSSEVELVRESIWVC